MQQVLIFLQTPASQAICWHLLLLLQSFLDAIQSTSTCGTTSGPS
uniref:Uncharacterized protein n=1 Tax=Macrostomum lignano TaxID=282301 RepID=A0A1I8FM66_9PLAT